MLAFAKSVAALAALPLATATALLLAAIALRFSRYRTAAISVAFLAGVVAYGGSIPLVGDALLRPLEQQYAPLSAAPPVDTVVVLGSSYSPRAGASVAAALDGAGLVRILSGVAWAQQLGATLVVSGGARPGRVPSADGYAALARELGVAEQRLVMLDEPLDTGDEATAVAALLGARPFLLVTSAYHMPRAMRLMERAGARPYAAPTDQQAAPHDMHPMVFVPQASALQNSEAALHEYLALLSIAAGVD